MAIVNLHQTPKQAFKAAFARGLAGSLQLYATQALPDEVAKVEFVPLPPRHVGDEGDDWRAVGSDLRRAIEKNVGR